MLTLLGERLLLHNLINHEKNNITQFAIGTEAQKLKKDITELGSTKLIKTPIINFDIKNNALEFLINLTGREINNVNELGLLTKDNELVLYDTFETISEPESSTTQLKCVILLGSEEPVYDWIHTAGKLHTYEVKIDYTVIGVFEQETDSGYIKLDNIDDVEETEASYYFNKRNNRLHIHCVDDANPNNLNINIRGV